jgi:gliding motility-associated-like protein
VIIEPVNVEVPNILTPNGDGKNDLFLPANHWIGVKDHKMMVFNRWGQKVWESSEFQKGWNGESLMGGKVSDGTYFWVLEYRLGNGLTKILKGSLTVLLTE